MKEKKKKTIKKKKKKKKKKMTQRREKNKARKFRNLEIQKLTEKSCNPAEKCLKRSWDKDEKKKWDNLFSEHG